jgi:hypothetical protein
VEISVWTSVISLWTGHFAATRSSCSRWSAERFPVSDNCALTPLARCMLPVRSRTSRVASAPIPPHPPRHCRQSPGCCGQCEFHAASARFGRALLELSRPHLLLNHIGHSIGDIHGLSAHMRWRRCSFPWHRRQPTSAQRWCRRCSGLPLRRGIRSVPIAPAPRRGPGLTGCGVAATGGR